MDPVQKMWMFYSWLEDKKESNESYKNHAYLVGGFSNPEMLQRIINADEKSVSVSEEEFEQSLKIVKDSHENTENKASLKRRRKRKKIGT